MKGCGAETRGLFRSNGSGLATNALVREGFHESLRVQVLVPKRGKAFMFAVKDGMKGILSLVDEARPLLNSGIVVAVVLCEAPDYVK